MHDTLLPFVAFFVGLMLIQQYHRKAMSRLSVDEKAHLLDITTKVGVWRMIPVIVLVLGFSAFTYWKSFSSHMGVIFGVYFLLIIASSFVANMVQRRAFRAHGLPSEYMRANLITAVATLVLTAGFFSWVMIPFVDRR